MKLGNGKWEQTLFNSLRQPLQIGLSRRQREGGHWPNRKRREATNFRRDRSGAQGGGEPERAAAV